MGIKIIAGGGVRATTFPLLTQSEPSFGGLGGVNPCMVPSHMGTFVLNNVAVGVLNRLMLVPFVFQAPALVNSIRINTTIAAGAGGIARLGLYICDRVRAYPNTPLFDSGSFATDGAPGLLGPTGLTIKVPGPSIVWAGLVCQVALPTMSMIPTTSVNPAFGLGIQAAAFQVITAAILDGIAGALPNPCTTGATLSRNSNDAPIITLGLT